MASPDPYTNETLSPSPGKHAATSASPIKYSYQDYLDIVSRPSMYSSVGKMTLSHKTSAPSASFGSAKRDVFVYQSKELSKNQFKGIAAKEMLFD